MKPLCVVGTDPDVGKTTTCIGLIGVLRERGLNVAYMKPLGQRLTTVHGEVFENDTLVMVQGMDLKTSAIPVPVPLGRGRVEEKVQDLHVEAMSKRITGVFPDFKRSATKSTIGPQIAQEIGLDPIREACPHFCRWVESLERLARV